MQLAGAPGGSGGEDRQATTTTVVAAGQAPGLIPRGRRAARRQRAGRAADRVGPRDAWVGARAAAGSGSTGRDHERGRLTGEGARQPVAIVAARTRGGARVPEGRGGSTGATRRRADPTARGRRVVEQRRHGGRWTTATARPHRWTGATDRTWTTPRGSSAAARYSADGRPTARRARGIACGTPARAGPGEAVPTGTARGPRRDGIPADGSVVRDPLLRQQGRCPHRRRPATAPPSPGGPWHLAGSEISDTAVRTFLPPDRAGSDARAGRVPTRCRPAAGRRGVYTWA